MNKPALLKPTDKPNASQFGVSTPIDKFIFEKDGQKNTLKLGRVGWIIIPICIALSMIPTVTPEKMGKQQNPHSTLPAPEISPPLEIPSLSDRTKNERNDLQKLKTPSSNSKTISKRLEAAEIMDRPSDFTLVPPGTMTKAILSSGASNGIVKATLTEDIRVEGDTVLKKGTNLLGTGKVQGDRLHIIFNQAILRDGTTHPIMAHALDSGDKIVGLKGATISNEARKIGSSIALGFVARLAQTLKNDSRPIFSNGSRPTGSVIAPNGSVITTFENQATNPNPSVGDALAETVGETLHDRSKKKLSEINNDDSLIEKSEGEEIFVLFDELKM